MQFFHLKKLKSEKVINKAKEKKLNIVDATCPYVERTVNEMKKKLLLWVLFFALYSISGWLLCIVQTGSSMISNYNQWLMLVLALLHLTLGIVTDILIYFFIKRKRANALF